MEVYKAEVKALNAALTAYIMRPPDPVPPPILPDIDTLVEALRPPIVASVREEISPMLRNLRIEVEGMLESNTRQISTALLAKLSRVLKTERYIQEWLERESKNQVEMRTDNHIVNTLSVNGVNGVSHTPVDGLPPIVASEPTPATVHGTSVGHH